MVSFRAWLLSSWIRLTQGGSSKALLRHELGGTLWDSRCVTPGLESADSAVSQSTKAKLHENPRKAPFVFLQRPIPRAGSHELAESLCGRRAGRGHGVRSSRVRTSQSASLGDFSAQ